MTSRLSPVRWRCPTSLPRCSPCSEFSLATSPIPPVRVAHSPDSTSTTNCLCFAGVMPSACYHFGCNRWRSGSGCWSPELPGARSFVGARRTRFWGPTFSEPEGALLFLEYVVRCNFCLKQHDVGEICHLRVLDKLDSFEKCHKTV